VASDAEDIVIRAAFRALAQRYHPDKGANTKTSGTRMQAIQAAYNVLSDPEKRRQYDRYLGKFGIAHNGEDVAEEGPFSTAFDHDFHAVDAAYPQWINQLEQQSWTTLLALYPLLAQRFDQLEEQNHDLASTYKNLLLELISEKLMAKAIDKITSQMQEAIEKVHQVEEPADSRPAKKQSRPSH